MTAPREVAMAQLEKANEVRSRRGRLKILIAEGRISVSEVMIREKRHLRRMKISELLLATPGLGKTKVTRALNLARIPVNATLQEVSAEHRRALLELIARKHPGVKL